MSKNQKHLLQNVSNIKEQSVLRHGKQWKNNVDSYIDTSMLYYLSSSYIAACRAWKSLRTPIMPIQLCPNRKSRTVYYCLVLLHVKSHFTMYRIPL